MKVMRKISDIYNERDKMRHFINFSNHSSSNWSNKQIIESSKYGEIVDIPFPMVEENASEEYISNLSDVYCEKILKYENPVVMVQGEFTLSFSVIHRLLSLGVKVVAACSERHTIEKTISETKNEKISVFEFTKYREYSNKPYSEKMDIYNISDIAKDTGVKTKTINDKKKNINVLIMALSTFNKRDICNLKTFVYNGKKYFGRYQLDPIPKVLSDELPEGECIDYILTFCTEKVKEKCDLECCIVRKDGSEGKGIVKNINAVDFFKRQVEDYISKDPNCIKEIDIDEYNPNDGVSNATKWLREVKESNPESHVKLYVDAHGGFRDVQLIIQSVIDLLSRDGFIVEKGYTVRFDGNNKSEIPITEDESLKMFDLSSGIDEFLNYGRITTLNRYIDKAELENDDKENTFKTSLACLSEGISLCNIEKFENGLEMLSSFFNSGAASDNDYLSIFYDTIKKDFGVLLTANKTILDEIRWCVKKEYYQQALTLIESKMPDVYVKNKIIYYDDNDGNNDIIQDLKNNNHLNHLSDYHLFFDTYLQGVNGFYSNDNVDWNSYSGNSNGADKWKYLAHRTISKEKINLLKGNGELCEWGKNCNNQIKNIKLLTNVAANVRPDCMKLFRLHRAVKQCRNSINHATENMFVPSLEDIRCGVERYIELAEKILKLNK